MPIAASDVITPLTGGATNTNPNLSLGGAVSLYKAGAFVLGRTGGASALSRVSARVLNRGGGDASLDID